MGTQRVDTFNPLAVYLGQIQTPLLTAEEEHELAVKATMGDGEAREKLIVSNLRLVVSIARRYGRSALKMDDLVAAGNEGLVKAVDKFDPTRGTRLSGYATYWIRQSISRVFGEERTIKLPVGVMDAVRKYRRVKTQLSKEIGRDPETYEIAERMEISEERLEELINLGQPGIPLDMSLDDSDREQLSGIFAESNDTAAFDNPHADLETEQAARLFEKLKENERVTLILRFGFWDNVCWTQEAIAGYLGLTRQRIQQIEVNALAKVARYKRIAGKGD